MAFRFPDRTRSWWTGWGLMTLLSVSIAGYAVMLLLVPGARPPFVHASARPIAFLLHFAGGAVALALGPWQFLTAPRPSRALHRRIGWVYAAAIAVGGSAGLLLAPAAQEGPVARLGFAMLALGWMGSMALAVRAARRGDLSAHRRWMVRNFAFTFAAVMLRLQLPFALAALGLPFATAYPVIAWACWVPNLVVAELVLRARPA